jgi:DNA-binding PadR family transcriptional regulator
MKRKRLDVDFVELHILYHASEGPIYGLWLLEELARHGYRFNASQLYPKLHRLERQGMLRHRGEIVDGRVRKYYRMTARGRRYWLAMKRRLLELVSEALSREDLLKVLEEKR